MAPNIPHELGAVRPSVGRSCSRRVGASSLRGLVEAPGAKLGRLAVALLLDEWPILGHIIESLKGRFKRNLIVPSKFLGSSGVGTMNGLVNDRRPYPPPLRNNWR